jgi:hypothetical protein
MINESGAEVQGRSAVTSKLKLNLEFEKLPARERSRISRSGDGEKLLIESIAGSFKPSGLRNGRVRGWTKREILLAQSTR